MSMNRFEKAAQERDEHQKQMAASYLTEDLPAEVTDRLYAYAWSEGHSCGFREVENVYSEIVSLVEAAYKAGRRAACARF